MLSAAMAPHVDLQSRFVAQPLQYLRSRLGRSRSDFAWQQLRRRYHLKAAVVPGLRRYPRASAWLLRRTYQGMRKRYGEPDAVVVDTPYLLEVLEAVEGPARIYLANDAYRFFAWDQQETERRERRLIQISDLTLAVAPLIVQDFRELGAQSVDLLPTAVSDEFVGAFRTGPRATGTALPADLAALPSPRILCIGNINDTYDWALIEGLMTARPAASLALVGPIQGEPSPEAARVLALPNVHWLGPRPHEQLPLYMAAADVLLSPLRPGEHSDRRFPLRITEYMASDRPILSTEIEPIRYFAGEVQTAHDGQEAATKLDAFVSGAIRVDPEARAGWIAANTWSARATQFVELMRQHGILDRQN